MTFPTSTVRVSLLACVLCLACESGFGDGGDGDSDVDTDTDSGTDSASDSDTDTDLSCESLSCSAEQCCVANCAPAEPPFSCADEPPFDSGQLFCGCDGTTYEGEVAVFEACVGVRYAGPCSG
jgi:hypothetical protein